MKLLLSIKPHYADRILAGTKRYEFRRRIFAQNVRRAVIYASSPVSSLVGEFAIHDVIGLPLDDLWSHTRTYAGVTEEDFYAYFAGLRSGFAIVIRDPRRYHKPRPLPEALILRPPQSFAYI
ncbi:MAG: hypothetical protein A2139_06450 [Desulfobacca sp. RBG_16_60_12]|nr:MAG: hypothetical protein A2139_06450 [Desulfobacca sp. RBG_16_60_12]